MKEQTKSNWKNYLVLTAITCAFLLTVNFSVTAQTLQYKSGDRVECDTTETGKWWTKGTIMPFQKGDFGGGQEPDGSWYHFKADYNGVEYPCKPKFIRPLAADKTKKPNEEMPETDKQSTEEENETTTGGDFLECPIEQKQVKNGSRPNAELVKKIIRCKKGEIAVAEGEEGAVKVEISSVQIGTSRPWSYSQDSGNAKSGTLVFPVKATYTVKTLYRNATEVEEGWVRVLNFYVNAFGEWQIGSEETIKAGKFKRIPK